MHDEDDIKRYLLAEMSERERSEFEDELVENDAHFFSVVELENDLTDKFVRGLMSAADERRFASSVSKVPERRTKLANARVLAQLIDERPTDATSTESVSPRPWWLGYLTVSKPAFAGLAAITVIFAVTSAVLFEQTRKKSDRIAELQTQVARTDQLEREVQDHSQSESALSRDLDAERQISQALLGSIEAGKSSTQKPASGANDPNRPDSADRQQIAMANLSPVALQGKTATHSDLVLTPNTAVVALRLRLHAPTTGKVDLYLNNTMVARGLAARGAASATYISAAVAASKFVPGSNAIHLKDPDTGAEIGRYVITINFNDPQKNKH